MKCGTRSLAVFGALTLSEMGLVPASWAVDVGQSGAVRDLAAPDRRHLYLQQHEF